MSKTLMCTEPNKLEWVVSKDRELEPKEVRVRSLFSAAKHGTETVFFRGEDIRRGDFDPELKVFRPGKRAPMVLGAGNMVVGQVIEIGSDVAMLSVGDRVAAGAPFGDMHVVSETACRVVPDGVPWQSAVCLDPGGCAVCAVRDGNVRVGDAVVVFGMGAIGLCAVQVSRYAGAGPVIAVEPLPERRRAAESLGAHLTLDPSACDAGVEIKNATGGMGADVIIDFSGSRKAVQDALRGIAHGGTVVAGSFPAPYDAGLDFGAEAHINVPNIVFSRVISDPNRDHPRWDGPRLYETTWRLILDGIIDGRPIVTPIVPFEDLMDEYPRVVPDPRAGIKLGARH